MLKLFLIQGVVGSSNIFSFSVEQSHNKFRCFFYGLQEKSGTVLIKIYFSAGAGGGVCVETWAGEEGSRSVSRSQWQWLRVSPAAQTHWRAQVSPQSCQVC